MEKKSNFFCTFLLFSTISSNTSLPPKHPFDKKIGPLAKREKQNGYGGGGFSKIPPPVVGGGGELKPIVLFFPKRGLRRRGLEEMEFDFLFALQL